MNKIWKTIANGYGYSKLEDNDVTDYELLLETFERLNILVQEEVVSSFGLIWYQVPKDLKEQIKLSFNAVGCWFCFDEDKKFIGYGVGDERTCFERNPKWFRMAGK
ncbi:hypothetical protein C4577_05095 [Candidatus Parcubacteria bacterium]|nr:MAG: hypothetical protein C4577_05095 [Candidatus Parcubacteria bacterium]